MPVTTLRRVSEGSAQDPLRWVAVPLADRPMTT